MKDHIIDVVFVLEDLVTAVRQLNETIIEFKPKTKKTYVKKAHAPKEYTVAFNEWWVTYPKLPRTGKRATFEHWWIQTGNNLPHIKTLKIATENYSSHIVIHGRLARDPERFLKDSWWKGWLNDGDHEGDHATGVDETIASAGVDSPSMG